MCNFAVAFRKECKTYCSIASQSPPRCMSKTSFIGTVPIRAQLSHIKKWFVVNREAYGESLRLLRSEKSV